jgi:hypothetical protein
MGTQESFMRLISEGNIKEADTLLQRNIIDWTMYNYSAAQKPGFAHNRVGKAMLSYSTYPTQFAEMLARMVKNDPMVGGRLAINIAALSYFYNDVLGLKGYEGNPLRIMMFTGGPLATGGLDAFQTFTQGVESLKIMDSNVMEKAGRLGEVAVSGLDPLRRILVPFNWYPKRFKSALQSLDEGEYYTSLLQGTGLNVNSDAMFPNVDISTIGEGLDFMGY